MIRWNGFAAITMAVCSLALFGCPPAKLAPTANFTAQTTLGVAPLNVQFTDTSSPGSSPIAQWAWTFGDGASSTQANPAHTYAQEGTYAVSLQVTTADGADTLTRDALITVAGADDLPVAGFSSSAGEGVAPLAVDFTDASTPGAYPITARLWTFGDGETSTEVNPSHTYDEPGFYDVSLRVNTALGSHTATVSQCVAVMPAAGPHAEFSAAVTEGYPPLVVQFTNESTAGDVPITEYFWVFGVGANSTLPNPAHTYTVPGTYMVTLTVSTPYDEDQMVKTNYIVVHQPLAPVAAFSSEMVSASSLEAAFTDESDPKTAPITQWAWDFGDGATSTAQHPHHVFPAEGTFTVSLTVTSAHGVDTSTQQVDVNMPDPPTASFTATPDDGLSPLVVTFTDTSTPGSAPITQWEWTFGDGAVSTQQHPVHTYTAEADYTARLRVTSEYGSSETTKVISVHQPIPPTAAFTVSPQSGSEPLLVTFTDQSDAGSGTIASWSWNFGDGGTSTEQSPEHTYNLPGTYDVSLSVTTEYGTGSLTKTSAVTVYETMVRINEIVTANDSGLEDEDGDREDWIELYNPKAAAVNLAGYSLSDDSGEPDKWVFPSVTIPAGGYLVLFASGKDRAPASGELHTNFKLSNEGEFLALFADPAEPAISQFSPKYPDQRSDYSYGVYQDGPEYRYFETPTPGAANSGTAYLGMVATPQFDHPRGFYSSTFDLALSTKTAGATIYYTLDGSEPTPTHGAVYSSPISVTQTQTVRAFGYKAGYLSSRIKTNTLVLNAPTALKTLPAVSLVLDEVAAFTGQHGLMYKKGGYWKGSISSPDSIKWDFTANHNPFSPTIDLNLAGADYNHFLRYHKDPGVPFPAYTSYPGTRPWERKASVEVIDPAVDPLADDAGNQADCGITVHGGDSVRGKFVRLGDTAHPFTQYHTGPDWMYHFAFKISFRLYFRDEYQDSSFQPALFSDPKLEKIRALVLRGGHNDWVNPFIKDELLRRIQGDAGHPYSRGSLVNLYINGVWKGYYNAVDWLNEDFFQEWYGSDEDWDVLTHNWWNPDTYEFLLGESNPVRDGDDDVWNELLDFAATHDLTEDANYQYVASLMDVANFIDYLIIQLYAADYDWLHTNWVVARERSATGKFTFYIWDAEKTMRSGDVDGGINFDGFNKNGDWAKNPYRYGLNGQYSKTVTGGARNESYAPISALYVALKNNTTFRQLWRDRTDVLFGTGGALSKANLTTRFNELRDELNPMIEYTANNSSSPYISLNQMDTFILDTWIPQREDILMGLFAVEFPEMFTD